MALELTYPHIEKRADQAARLVRHLRVRVAQIVMDYLAYGWSPDEMCRQHSYLTPAEAHAAMAYYFDHQQEVDAEIQAEVADAERAHQAGEKSPVRMKLRRSSFKTACGEGDSPILLRRLRKIGTFPGGFETASGHGET